MTMRQSRFKRICVFCGSSQGKKPSYHDAAIGLGNELVRIELALSLNSIFTTTSFQLNLPPSGRKAACNTYDPSCVFRSARAHR